MILLMVSLIVIYAAATATFNLPPGLLSAVCYVESHHKSRVIHKDDGGEDSIGLCQLHESTARMLGYKGPKLGLLNPKINSFYSAKYLRMQLDRYEDDFQKAVSAYNMGTHKVNAQGLTVNRKYVKKVFQAWADGK